MAQKRKKKTAKQMAKFRRDLTFDDLVLLLINESPIENIGTKTLIAESVAMLRFQIRDLLERQTEARLTGDELRALSGMTSNMRRLLEQLGSTDLDGGDWDF